MSLQLLTTFNSSLTLVNCTFQSFVQRRVVLKSEKVFVRGDSTGTPLLMRRRISANQLFSTRFPFVTIISQEARGASMRHSHYATQLQFCRTQRRGEQTLFVDLRMFIYSHSTTVQRACLFCVVRSPGGR